MRKNKVKYIRECKRVSITVTDKPVGAAVVIVGVVDGDLVGVVDGAVVGIKGLYEKFRVKVVVVGKDQKKNKESKHYLN